MKSATKIRRAMKKMFFTKKMVEEDKNEKERLRGIGPWGSTRLMVASPFERGEKIS